MAVWTLILQSEPEGPTLISCAARLLKGDSQISSSRRRGAPTSAIWIITLIPINVPLYPRGVGLVSVRSVPDE